METNQKTFFAKIDQLRAMLDWIRSFLVRSEFESSAIRKVELASEEALVNIIRHAYRDSPGQIEIEVKVFPKSRIEISIKDSGPPFDPLKEKGELNTDAPLEERKIGGLGIHFMHEYMDEVKYKRAHNQNVLLLIKISGSGIAK